MSNALAISVRLHEGWYHGSGSIPSPARLFQALMAGRGLSGPLPEESILALQWLEQQPPPIVATPATRGGQPVTTYVPNNDLDAKGGDHRRMGEIRTKKSIRPLLFDAEVPFMYCWHLTDESEAKSSAEHICELADGLYQLGRTVDAAWACAELISTDAMAEKLRSHRGPVHRPSAGRGNVECPTSGTVASLIRRHADMAKRYDVTADRKGQTFRRRGKPKWRLISYENSQTRAEFDLSDRATSALASWPTTAVVDLVTEVRDAAVERLVTAMPDRESEIRQTLVGRKLNGENAGPISARVQIIPLPSIGHEHADQQIRRIVIEVPANCPLRADDVVWAFSGLTLRLHGRDIDLVPAQPHRQLEHYGIDCRPSYSWQTVTPIALTQATRRRIEPNRSNRTADDNKGAAERRLEQEQATSALRQALRHSGVSAQVIRVHLQREPFSGRGKRVEDFARGDRFNKHSLWHANLAFDRPISGPLLLGDGRFMGLGLLEPSQTNAGVFAFSIESGLADDPDPVRLAKSLRRAVMARVGNYFRETHLPTYFSGHTTNGPADSVAQPHLTYVFHPTETRLLVIQPTLSDNARRESKRHTHTLELALDGFNTLHAGPDGAMRLNRTQIDESTDPLFAPSSSWTSLTPYRVNRHAKKTSPEEVIIRDVLTEIRRRELPRPRQVTVLDWKAITGAGLQASLRLEFINSVSGPICLGKTRHHGGGLFQVADSMLTKGSLTIR